jgi:hypothetical protein
MAGDKPYGERKVEAVKTEINLLSVGDHRDVHTLKMHEEQEALAREIAKAHERCMAVAGKLAAYYPNGYYGVVDNMKHGPARDVIQAHINRSV